MLFRFPTDVPARSGRAAIRGECGQALVETAIVLPLLVLLILAILKGGIVFNNWIMLTDAVRSGARVLAISRIPGVDACVQARAALLNAASTLVTPTPTITINVTASCTSLTQGSDATVSATYPCDMALLGVWGPCTLRASTTERVE